MQHLEESTRTVRRTVRQHAEPLVTLDQEDDQAT